MLNLVREGEEDYIKAIRYRRRLKIFENFLLAFTLTSGRCLQHQNKNIHCSVFYRYSSINN